MINISKLEKENSEECFQLINYDSKDKNYFKSLGWSKNQFILQFNKNTNYSVGLYDNNQLELGPDWGNDRNVRNSQNKITAHRRV